MKLVTRLSLGSADMEGATNAYLLEADGRTILIDTADPDREGEFSAALRDAGVAVEDVDDVFLTHWHHDHTGLAGTIQRESGATVRCHERDAPLTRQDRDAWTELVETQKSYLEAWGVPEAKRAELPDFDDRERFEGPRSPSSLTPFSGGETFTFGESSLTVLHTPGHTAGSVCFSIDDAGSNGSNGRLVTGDFLLPEYTPNVGGTDVRLEQPLIRYLDALYTLAGSEYDVAWPGHRSPIEDPTNRAREIVAHHEQRAGQILAILAREGPADVWTLSTELFGDLEGFHVLIGAGEAYAHLAHLEEQGDVALDDGEYHLVDEVESRIDGELDTWGLAVSE